VASTRGRVRNPCAADGDHGPHAIGGGAALPRLPSRARGVVAVARWDDLFAPFRNCNMFLKIDTRGYERSILEGAREALSQVIGVQSDLPLVYLYRETWSLGDAPMAIRACPGMAKPGQLPRGAPSIGDRDRRRPTPSKRRRMNRAK